jgi:hypothetical protein
MRATESRKARPKRLLDLNRSPTVGDVRTGKGCRQHAGADKDAIDTPTVKRAPTTAFEPRVARASESEKVILQHQKVAPFGLPGHTHTHTRPIQLVHIRVQTCRINDVASRHAAVVTVVVESAAAACAHRLFCCHAHRRRRRRRRHRRRPGRCYCA